MKQVSQLECTVLSRPVIDAYHRCAGTDLASIRLRVQAVRTIGALGGDDAAPFLSDIIERGGVSPDIEQAILVAKSLCLTELIDVLDDYREALGSELDDGLYKKKKALCMPEFSYELAGSTVEALQNGACGN